MNSVRPLPEWIERVVEAAPPFSDKRGLAKLFSECFGPISLRPSKTALLSGGSSTVAR